MRFHYLLCLIPLTFALAGAPAGAQAASQPKANQPLFKVRQTSTEADLGGASMVTIEDKFGHVWVKAGTPRVKIEQAAYATGKTQAEAAKKVKGFHVTTKRDAKEGLKITVEGDQKNMDVGYDLVVSMPITTKVKVRASDGDVRVDDFAADVSVDGSNGAAVIGHVKGKVGASTAAGDITIASATNGVEAQTSSGSIKLTGATGKCVLRTMSGGIKASIGKSPKIIASTMSGAISVTVTAPFSGELQASSSSGDIRVAIPTNSDVKVSTATGSGPTSCTLPLKDVKRNGPNYDAGHLGAGKGAVRITNDSGGIALVATK